MAVQAVIGLLRARIGLEHTSVGKGAVESAIRARMDALSVASQEVYLELLRDGPGELDALVEEIVVPETWFFREPAAYALLRERALSRAPSASEPYRVLSVPCATGEEPYSIAMALLDAGVDPAAFRVRGVDVSRRALALAERAVYREISFRGGVSHYERYFEPHDGGRRVVTRARAQVQLAFGNVLEGTLCAGEQFDVVLCRNLLIYLDRDARVRAFRNLRRLLRPEGLLLVGHAEAAVAMEHGFVRTGDAQCFAFAEAGARPAASRLPAKRSIPARPARRARSERPARASTVRRELDSLEALRALADRGELGEARRRCEALLSAESSAPAYALLGVVCQAAGDLPAARQAFERALYLEPGCYEALLHLALIHERAGQRELASNYRKRAERNAPSERGTS